MKRKPLLFLAILACAGIGMSFVINNQDKTNAISAIALENLIALSQNEGAEPVAFPCAPDPESTCKFPGVDAEGNHCEITILGYKYVSEK